MPVIIKNFKGKLKRKLIDGKIVLLGLFLAFFFIGLYALQIRFNYSKSMPLGFYKISENSPIKRGDTVSFCLEENNLYAQLVKDRKYLGAGTCPTNLQPLLKIVGGVPGDLVEFTDTGIFVNGQKIKNSIRPLVDSKGRKMPPSLLGNGFIPKGFVLVVSFDSELGFDSRHFGLIPKSSLKKVNSVLTVVK
jgi:conjugative transfer signal peptidase TraF